MVEFERTFTTPKSFDEAVAAVEATTLGIIEAAR